MKPNYTPSVNIIRDAEKELNYIVTDNAEKSALKILNNFNKGIHSFSIIGSYGTGKSSFLWAFQQSLNEQKGLFNLKLPNGLSNVEVINFVGEYNSLISAFNETFSINKDFSSHQNLFDSIFQKYADLGDSGLLVLIIDEFGKFLEYAANHQPEKEMYFIQQLAEFVNDPTRNIILLTTLHQGLDTYASKLADSQKNEWRKVKGRLQEITFNEPVEQLLSLAANHFKAALGTTEETDYSKKLLTLQESNYIFSSKGDYFKTLKNSLFPLDIFSAYVLTLSLQKYGQNERSLFSFLQASDELGLNDANRKDISFSLASVYDYLLSNYYHFLTTSASSDYSKWNSIRETLQRIEMIDSINTSIAEDLIKTIGLLHIFASKGAKINDEFLLNYLSNKYSTNETQITLELLVKWKLIRYSNFNFSYNIFAGTDLDIEGELNKAENQVSEVTDLVNKLDTYFNFPIVTAKANSYQTGTPRLFDYKLSEKPISLKPIGEIDGFINLIFNGSLRIEDIQNTTQTENNAILYGFFKNTDKISSALFEIEKTKQVLKNIEDDGDKVAIRELQKILKSNQTLLNHFVLDSLYSKQDVVWIYKGEVLTINNKKVLNKTLSKICNEIYHATPILKNELFNKHKPSGAIASARKSYFNALTEHFDQEDLGFDINKFPPEKTIYYTLLHKSGMHIKTATAYTLTRPKVDSDLIGIWKVCEDFLSSAKDEPKKLTELIDLLSAAPYKLKQGVIEFWVPTFFFLRRGDYALYSEGKFKPKVNSAEIQLMVRTPQHYTIKSFELNDLRLSFFNKYRDFLNQDQSQELNVNTFIESIRPILLTYTKLNSYCQNTKRISKDAIQLRSAIQFAKDPEKVFFDEFPKALGFDVSELLKSDTNFDNYIYKFQNTLEEINKAYDALLNRIEQFITSEIIGKPCDFKVYKKALKDRFSSLKEHQLIAKQKTFIQRVNSPLNDRDSWLASISQTLLGKTLTSIEDKDEAILKDKLKHIILELDNLSVIDKVKFDKSKEEVVKIDFTSTGQGLMPHLVRIPKAKIKSAEENISLIKKELGQDKQMRIAILAKLLQEELNHE